MRDFKRERPIFSGRGRLKPMIAGLCPIQREGEGGENHCVEYKDSRPQNHRALFPLPPTPARGRGFGVDSISRDAPRGDCRPPSPALRVGYAPGNCGYAPAQLAPLVLSCSELRAGCMPFMRRVTCERNKILFLMRSNVAFRATFLHYPLSSAYLMCYLSISQKHLLYLRILRESEAEHLPTR